MKVDAEIESKIISTALGRIPRPPVDLYEVARSLRVNVRATSFRSGFTDFSGRTPIIYLNNTEPGARIRFIFAHELAHVMLRLPRVMQLVHRCGLADLVGDQENFADRIATTLLIPDYWIEDFLSIPDKLRWVQDFTSRANVPVAMMVTRLAFYGTDIALLHWRKRNGAWHVIDRPGVPASLHGYIKLTDDGGYTLDNLKVPEANVNIDCYINGSLARLDGIGYRQNGHVFHFLEPSRDIRFDPGHRPGFDGRIRGRDAVQDHALVLAQGESSHHQMLSELVMQGLGSLPPSDARQNPRGRSRTEPSHDQAARRRAPAHAKKSRRLTWPITHTRTAIS